MLPRSNQVALQRHRELDISGNIPTDKNEYHQATMLPLYNNIHMDMI